MKTLFSFFAVIILLGACSPKEESNQTTTENSVAITPNIDINEEIFSFDINTLKKGCNNNSQLVCAINLTVKCTVNPKFAECASAKKNMPKFIFMEDENLKRPTSQSYKITKIKPIAENMVEVYTKSTCNGNWFGLCNGNIIYVMNQVNGQWTVKDIYAIES